MTNLGIAMLCAWKGRCGCNRTNGRKNADSNLPKMVVASLWRCHPSAHVPKPPSAPSCARSSNSEVSGEDLEVSFLDFFKNLEVEQPQNMVGTHRLQQVLTGKAILHPLVWRNTPSLKRTSSPLENGAWKKRLLSTLGGHLPIFSFGYNVPPILHWFSLPGKKTLRFLAPASRVTRCNAAVSPPLHRSS